jgi:hypothetical protein
VAGRTQEAQKVAEVFVNGLAGENLHTAGVDLDVWESELPDCPFTPEELPCAHLEVPPPLLESQEAIRYARSPEGNIRGVEYLIAVRLPKWGILDWICFDYETEIEYFMRVDAERFCEQVMYRIVTTSPWMNLVCGEVFPHLTES